jgi:predicted glycosyltransferase
MACENLKRVLVYTHNSIGLGHAFRTLAVVTGMRKCRPDINFLVLSSCSIPQIFFDQGIEVVKLPSVKIDIDRDDNRMSPRYLNDFDLESVFEFRQRLILETFDFFKPDALIIEHNMTGQMSELIPLLMKKWMRQGGPADFALAHVCRGIMRWVPLLKIPYQNPRHRSESINIGALYDFMYVLEDRGVIDINKAFLGDDPDLERKIRYLGKVTNKLYEEIPDRATVLKRFGLQDRPTAIVSLGRNGHVSVLHRSLLKSFHECGMMEKYQVVIFLDPYLDPTTTAQLRVDPLAEQVHFAPFTPNLVDIMRHSELIVSRAGYNTVNEILLTGVRALVIPESHGGGEQEQRAKTIAGDGISVLSETQVMEGMTGPVLREILSRRCLRQPRKFDKYSVGTAIVKELEEWKARRREC